MKLHGCAAVVVLALCSAGAIAQEGAFPIKPVRVLVGGGSDVIIRLLGEKLTEAWRQQVIVDNRPGASGAIAADVVAKAPPDGYTLLLVAPTFAMNAALKIANYDHVKDFSPIVLSVAQTPFVLVVHPSLPVRSVKDLIALARARPGQLNFGSPQAGGPTHLNGELFKLMAGIDMVHVPYKGVPAVVAALLSGEVQMVFAVAPSVVGHMKSGRLRGLAVTTAQRSPLVPGLPSVSESGLPGYEVAGWNGFLAPANTPEPIVSRINSDVLKALKRPEVHERLFAAGYLTAADNTPKEFAEFLRREFQKWSGLAKESGTRLN